MNHRRLGFIGTLSVLLGACQSTGEKPGDTVVTAGQPQKIARYYELKPDCTTLGPVAVRVSTPPQHGTTSTVESMGNSNYPAGDPRSVCNARLTPGTDLIYTAKPGYTGPDQMAGFIYNPSSYHNAFRVGVVVR